MLDIRFNLTLIFLHWIQPILILLEQIHFKLKVHNRNLMTTDNDYESKNI